MTTPIPLTDPDGVVRAWACGTCGQIDAIENGARTCCRDCLVCLGRLCLADDTICSYCCAVGRRAFEVLAAIGMAVAARAYGDARAWKAADATTRAYEADRRSWPIRNTAAADPGLAENRDASLAALCGVDAETVRRWRS